MSERFGENGSGGEHVTGSLSAYMDERLDEGRQARVREHLEVCPDCRADYTGLRATQHLLRSLPQVPLPRAFTLTPEMVAHKQGFWQRLLSPGHAPSFAFGSALAFVLLAFFVVGSFLGQQVNATFSRIGSGLGEGSAAYDTAPAPAAPYRFSMSATETPAAAALGGAAQVAPTPRLDFFQSAPTQETTTSAGTGGAFIQSEAKGTTPAESHEPNGSSAGSTLTATMAPAAGQAQGAPPAPAPNLPIAADVAPSSTSTPSTDVLRTQGSDYGNLKMVIGTPTPGVLARNAAGPPTAPGLEAQPSPTNENAGPPASAIVMVALLALGLALALGAFLARRGT